jgi:hypothetical protein
MAERNAPEVCHEFAALHAKNFLRRMEKPGVRQTNPLSSNSAARKERARMQSIKLADPSVNSIFTIPASAWAAIANRVSLVQKAAPAASIIQQFIPPFPALVTGCQQWVSSTFPGIIVMSRQLASYAATAIDEFSELQESIDALGNGGGAGEAAVLAQARTAIAGLSTATSTLQTAFVPVTAGVIAFAQQNAAVDAVVARNIQRLGTDWTALTNESAALQQAAGAVRGGWSAIGDDLQSVAGRQFNFTIPFILSLDIGSALLAWTNIEERASAFATEALGS